MCIVWSKVICALPAAMILLFSGSLRAGVDIDQVLAILQEELDQRDPLVSEDFRKEMCFFCFPFCLNEKDSDEEAGKTSIRQIFRYVLNESYVRGDPEELDACFDKLRLNLTKVTFPENSE